MSQILLAKLHIESEVPVCFKDDAVEFEGYTAGLEGRQRMRFTPDESKGYMSFEVCHAFPSIVEAFGLSAMPEVIHASFKSMLNQNVNLEHRLKLYAAEDKKKNEEDHFLGGCVVGVDFPGQPTSGWTMASSADRQPHIKGVMSFSKAAAPMKRILGEHLSGRHQYTVSMEAIYPLKDSGFAVMRGSATEFKDTTPAGKFDGSPWEYVPWSDAPDKLKCCYSEDKQRMVAAYSSPSGKDRKAILLMGGLNKPIHFAGLGVVRYGAEKKASIQRMAASGVDELVTPFRQLADLLGEAAKRNNGK